MGLAVVNIKVGLVVVLIRKTVVIKRNC